MVAPGLGSKDRLRFSPAEMTALLEVLDSQRALWQRARDVFCANRYKPDWRQIVKAECAQLGWKNSVEDDLLDAVCARTKERKFGSVLILSWYLRNIGTKHVLASEAGKKSGLRLLIIESDARLDMYGLRLFQTLWLSISVTDFSKSRSLQNLNSL